MRIVDAQIHLWGSGLPSNQAHRQVTRFDTAEALAGSEGASNVFWSPDSRHLGFVSDGVLKRIPVTGGSVQVLCALPDAFGTSGAAWARSPETALTTT